MPSFQDPEVRSARRIGRSTENRPVPHAPPATAPLRHLVAGLAAVLLSELYLFVAFHAGDSPRGLIPGDRPYMTPHRGGWQDKSLPCRRGLLDPGVDFVLVR